MLSCIVFSTSVTTSALLCEVAVIEVDECDICHSAVTLHTTYEQQKSESFSVNDLMN